LSSQGRNRRQRSRRTSVCSGAQGIRQNVVPLREMSSFAPWIPVASQAECGCVLLPHNVIRHSVKLYRPQPRGASIGRRVVLVGQPLLMIMPSVIHSLMPSTVADVWRIVARNRSCEKLRKKLKLITKSCA
jgi:hypothetical protein